MNILQRLDRGFATLEKGLLVSVVLIMIGMAVLQIILRNGFGFGIIWAEPLVRSMVLWTALLGGMLAARDNEHIKIDVLLPLLPSSIRRGVVGLMSLFAAAVCLLASYFCLQFVLIEQEFGAIAFAQLPNWLIAVILPVAFAVMGLRYFALTLNKGVQQQGGVS